MAAATAAGSAARRLAIPSSLRIADPHVHFWTLKTFPWLEDAKKEGAWIGPACRDYLPKTYMEEMTPLKIERTVHVQANWHAGVQQAK